MSAILSVEMQAAEVDTERHQHTQANLDGFGDLKYIVSCRFMM